LTVEDLLCDDNPLVQVVPHEPTKTLLEISALAVCNGFDPADRAVLDNRAEVPQEVGDYINDGTNIKLCTVCGFLYGATCEVYDVCGHDVPRWTCAYCD